MTDNETLNATQSHPDAFSSWVTDTWHLWQSDAGAHYATRSRYLTEAQMRAGYERTVPADTAEELRHLLLKQPDAPADGRVS